MIEFYPNLPFIQIDLDYTAIIDQTVVEALRYLHEEKCYYLINDPNYIADLLVDSMCVACHRILCCYCDSVDDFDDYVCLGIINDILPEEWYGMEKDLISSLIFFKQRIQND